jgi:hypothetical protein
MNEHFGTDFEQDIEQNYINFRKKAIEYARNFKGDAKINDYLLDHIRVLVTSMKHLEEKISACGRFTEEEITGMKKKIFLNDT